MSIKIATINAGTSSWPSWISHFTGSFVGHSPSEMLCPPALLWLLLERERKEERKREKFYIYSDGTHTHGAGKKLLIWYWNEKLMKMFRDVKGGKWAQLVLVAQVIPSDISCNVNTEQDYENPQFLVFTKQLTLCSIHQTNQKKRWDEVRLNQIKSAQTKSMNYIMNCWINRSIKQQTNQSINQSINQLNTQPTSQPTNRIATCLTACFLTLIDVIVSISGQRNCRLINYDASRTYI